ncbi:hypothetical protein EMPS_04096 [Entomortierella parvispora]|uniref:Thioredoxin domain-containing protein n=1 Tax=Entomortierella parvispora TaxID=205924 RepID=A0A9P3LV92_9FUNG|nr:hypothetical protein EMPS_04096 [Entomortierella parvispora]
MTTQDTPLTKEEQFNNFYLETLHRPFKDQYDDKWQEEPFWAAVEVFKAQVKEIGYDDPLERLKSYQHRETFEKIRDSLKAGPPACLRPGWVSPYTGARIDVVSVLGAIHHVGGPKYEGKERIVLLDFWASWCGPCISLGLELSDLSEKLTGQVAIIGINNEGMLGRHPLMMGLKGVKEFINTKKENFRYSLYVDNVDEYIRDEVFRKTEYVALPCIVLVVDGEVSVAVRVTKRISSPKAFETHRSSVTRAHTVGEHLLPGEGAFHEPADVQKLFDACDDVLAWMKEKEAAQEKLALWQDGVVTAREIQLRGNPVEREMHRLMSKKKPKVTKKEKENNSTEKPEQTEKKAEGESEPSSESAPEEAAPEEEAPVEKEPVEEKEQEQKEEKKEQQRDTPKHTKDEL